MFCFGSSPEKEAEQKAKQNTFSFASGGQALAEEEAAVKATEEEDDSDKVVGLDENYFWIDGTLNGYTRRLYDDMIQRFKKLDSSPEVIINPPPSSLFFFVHSNVVVLFCTQYPFPG